jgi:hypothetical protein
VLALHASAVETPGGALLFLGHAGAGKSTVVRLLADHFPTLADDAVFLLPQKDGAWCVADGSGRAFRGPLSSEEAAALRGPPLRAVVRLYKDSEGRLERLGPRETCHHLVDAAFEIAWPKRADAATARRMFSTVAEIARCYPGWQLRHSRDQTTCDLVVSTFS